MMTMNIYHKLAWIAPGLLSIKNIEKNRHSQLILWHKFCKQDIIRRMNMKTLQWRGQTQILKGISFVWYWIGDVIFKVLVRLLVRIRVDGGDNVVGCDTEFPDVTSPDAAPSLLRAACSWEFQHDDTSGPMPMDLSARRPNKVLAEYIQTFRIFRTKKIHFLTSKFMPKQLEKMSVWRKWTKWLRKERNVIFYWLLNKYYILHFIKSLEIFCT